MDPKQTFVIVGASLAGAAAAQVLREEGFDGQIVLIGSEPNRPYERPPLSKGLLLGTAPLEDVFVHPSDWYAWNDIDLRLATTVTSIDRAARVVVCDDGRRVGYDRLLLTTGSEPRRLTVPGAGLDGVVYLRRLEDCELLKIEIDRASRVAIIGGGWIGLEVAAAARAAGREVAVIETAELPLLRVLGREVAQIYADLHHAHGVRLLLGAQVVGLTGDGLVTGVELADGSAVPADLVVVGIGITPVVALAADAGLDVTGGVLVDEHLCTADPAVFAAGDVANAYHPTLRRRLRVEHWENARRQGAIAAKAMLGQDATFDRLPYFFSDQYDLGMEYVGYVEPGEADQVVFRGEVRRHEFIAFWLAGGRVLAGMNVNVWDVVGDIEDLIASARTVDPARLADPSIPLAAV
ncbi:NAD(P)/FAD-dependent oxidoreductase [Pengzhenrongella frigida]|uniref:NAD(P)/FAD-dependent oxidoreductase n=1 Tax=Pengzhenrongella frigida TaxID=1259133 RepID=A0A4Q5N543_9MICO|nr:FAD-dependent oxidoreductase [Cellulomonas sp. HLT2-17]RYV51877.1 NAD(P)/FAD-dependent oxidoreductase [Cellulomonas sp. HLT2-17]